MNTKIAILGILAATISASPAASIIVDTTGTMNPNNLTITEAGGNSVNLATYQTTIGTAYANNTGGVWNFDTAFSQVDVGDTITLNYGTSLSNTIVMTLAAGNSINQGLIAGEATSGTTELGLAGDASTRTFTLSTPVTSIAIFSLDRNDASRTSVLTVTYQDTTTASTSGANGDNTYFQELSGTVSNPIVSFTLTQNNFIRYDDLAFTVVPEPSTVALVGLGLAVSTTFFRRRRVLG